MTKKVITYGTFDMFHIGHLRLLKRLHDMYGYVIVALSTDEFNLKEKSKKTLIPFDQRKEILESIRYVDLVIPETSWDQKTTDVQKYNVDAFSIGDDWQGKFDFLKEFCEVVYLKRTQNISTTQLKKSLTNFLSVPKDDLLKVFEVLDAFRKELL